MERRRVVGSGVSTFSIGDARSSPCLRDLYLLVGTGGVGHARGGHPSWACDASGITRWSARAWGSRTLSPLVWQTCAWCRRRSTVGAAAAVLYRRVIEIADGRLALRPYLQPGVEDAPRWLGRGHGLEGEQLAAVVEAAHLRTAALRPSEAGSGARVGSPGPSPKSSHRRTSSSGSSSWSPGTARPPPRAESAGGWGLGTALFAGVLPLAYLVRGARRGRWSDHHVGEREKRPTVILAILASVLVGVGLLVLAGAPRELLALMGAMAAGLVVTLAVTLVWKVSVHAAVAGGTVVVLALVFGPALKLLWPLVALIAWSRVELSDHTTLQVLAGAALGAAVAGITFTVLT